MFVQNVLSLGHQQARSCQTKFLWRYCPFLDKIFTVRVTDFEPKSRDHSYTSLETEEIILLCCRLKVYNMRSKIKFELTLDCLQKCKRPKKEFVWSSKRNLRTCLAHRRTLPILTIGRLKSLFVLANITWTFCICTIHVSDEINSLNVIPRIWGECATRRRGSNLSHACLQRTIRSCKDGEGSYGSSWSFL